MVRMRGGGITQLTEVQAKCIAPGIAGRDILARSQTGSGKSLAFLIASVERILRHGGPDANRAFPIVILTPITDLAKQIAGVASDFLAYHGSMKVDVVIGGSSERDDIRRLSKDRIDVLVATPGRFKSILSQTPQVRERLASCQTFVIDEVDKLTDPGFLKDTMHIHGIASQNRSLQTLAFSATMDDRSLMKIGLLKDDAVFVDVKPDKVKVSKVRQVVVITPVSSILDAVIGVIEQQKGQKGGGASPNDVENFDLSPATRAALSEWQMPTMKGYRVMVFLPSNAFIEYFAKAFRVRAPDVKTFSIHGGLQQHQRTKTSSAFRITDDCVLFTSDASARGVDYPDVTCVVQIGFDTRDEYIQRVGRTGRAGKSGEGYLVIAPQEVSAAEQVCDLLQEVFVEDSLATSMCETDKLSRFKSHGVGFPASDKSLHHAAKQGFRGWLGSLASKWKRLRMNPSDAIELAQDMSVALGLGRMDENRLKEKLHVKTR